VVKQWPKVDDLGGVPCLITYYTAPAGGGAVSSRELVDTGVLVEEEKKLVFVNCR
jgi:hypothetical protein